MSRARALLLAPLLPMLVAARTPDPQQHEVLLDVDLQLEEGANGSLINAQYTFTPGAINRNDDVVPILRRFVRHPSAIWARIIRSGGTREDVTGGRAGGILQLLGGHVYATGEAGVEYDNVDYDPFEHAYWAVPFEAEIGVRPIDLLSIGGFYAGRTIIGNVTDDTLNLQAERSGFEQRFGLTTTAATPNDRVFASLSLWLARSDWTFEGFHPGDLTVRGFGASLRVAFQVTSSTTFQISGRVRSETWNNERDGDEVEPFVGFDLERNVVFAQGNADLIYWHRGRYGFRVGLGGGYETAPPTINNRDTAIVRFGLGLITRF